MSDHYQDEVPQNPEDTRFWIRNRRTNSESLAYKLRGNLWIAEGYGYDDVAMLQHFQFGPAIPTAAELAGLREIASAVAWLDNAGLTAEYLLMAQQPTCVLLSGDKVHGGGIGLVNAIHEAQKREQEQGE